MKMRGHSRRLLSVLLALVMLLSLLPTAVLAADPTPGTWKKIAFADITAGDTIAITMTKDKTTWVLPNDGTAQKAAPAITGTVSGDTLTTTSESQFGWKVIKSTDTFQLVSASDNTKYLYSTDKNNGIRQGKGESRDWKVDATSGYLFNVAQKRYVGVYNQQDWRSYTTLHDNIAGQTLNFWKLDTVPARQSGIVTDLTTLQDGDTVVVFNPANNKALSSDYAGTFYNQGTAVTLADGKLTGYTKADIWTVGVNADGTYTFSTADGKKLAMNAKNSSMPLDGDNPNWKITPAATKGCFYIQNTVRNNYIEWYADKGNWSSYYNIGNNEALFAQQLYLVIDSGSETPDPEPGPTALIKDGKYVIYNPGSGKAMSANATGTYYRAGKDVTVTNGKVDNPSADLIWTVSSTDGIYTITTSDGKKLSMNADRNSLPLDEVNDTWKVEKAKTDGCFYLINANRPTYYVEWFVNSSKGFEEFTTYTYKEASDNLYTLQFIPVSGSDQPSAGLPNPGDQVVIYNQNAQAVLAAQNDNATSPAINKAAATIKDGKAACANGAAVFTVEKSGDYYRFHNKTYGYLCAGGTGNNAFYSATAGDDADWLLRTCSGGVGGYEMESRTAKYKGHSQWLEYYSDSFKVYSMYNVTDYTIYSFSFYPVGPGTILDGVVNNPAVILGDLPDAYVGTDYAFTFTVDAPFGVQGDITAKLNGAALTVTKGEDGTYTVTIPAASVTGDKLTVNISGADNKYIPISAAAEITVKDEPVLADPTPARGSQTGENKRPTISVALSNAGQNPTVTMTVGGKTVTATYEGGRVTYTPAADLPQGRTEVTVTVRRADSKSASITWFFTVGTTKYQHYFGQLHSHTQYSDGAGTLTDALRYVENLPASANVQFVAFTDHSNYFDSSSSPNEEAALYNASLVKDSDASHSWKTYKDTIAKFNEDNAGSMVAIGGFEMTWSGGPGHINTFNTPGIVSRNNKTLNNKTDDAGMKAYYALLSQAEGATSISQFNHPGTTFGNFKDFNYWDPVIDSRMYMVEVGNGEGAIGAGGYYPSYEQYIMALDKGWHLAPTNNQDNHKGKWGNANDARDVILTDDFSEQGIYEAIRALRMYATEDKNLELTYTVNGLMMGSSITEIPDKLNVEVTVNDPDASDSIAKVEVVANSGKVAYTWDNAAQLTSGKLSATLDPSYSYYFIRVTQKDGDLAVTSPVWVGESLKLGISNMVCGTATPVTDEELTLTTTFFNSEDSDATIKSLTYSIGGTVIGTDKTGYTLAKSSTLDVPFKYTPTAARVFTVQVTAVVEQGNNEYTFTKTIGLDVLNADSLVYIGIDASHYNEYVSGNYKDSMGNFGNLAADHSVRTVQLNTGADLIAACSNPKYKALILTAPSRRLADAQKDPKTYSDAELKALAAFNAAGGTVILAGWSDNYENYDVIQKNPAIKHMAETQNDVLKALGSSLRISDDATYDDVRSAADGVDKWRLYFSTYNTDNFLTSGVIVDADHPYDKLYTERFSHYGGASIYAVDANGNPASTLPSTVSPVVYGHATTYSIDVDKDGKGGAGTPKYAYAENDNRLLVMATEQLAGKGLIVVSGAAFMSNFEVQAQLDNGAEKNYSNYRICENLASYLNPVQLSTIAQIHQQPEEGFKYTVEGIVTSNASGHDKDTAFFDCIYIQDETGGINCFPVAGDFKIGDRVRVSGTTSSYQGERQLAVTKIEKIGDGTPVTPEIVTSTQVNDGSVLGRLVTLKGIVTAIEMAEGKVQTILVRDPQGKVARVFIDGYICPDSEVQNLKVGCAIEATGLASYDNTFVLSDGTAMAPRIRISNRADVICTDHTHAFGAWTVTTPATCTASGAETRKCACGETETRLLPATGHTDANKDGKCDLCGQTLTPATGDTMHLTLWLSLMALTALAGVALTRQKKRRA